ncbi:MAG: hypothetical protein H0V66_09850 [Bdellovibrionales bacterium]|nr:hypothetical protein [Bdellovibrionales bacterium]
MRLVLILLSFSALSAQALEVVKFEGKKTIELRIVRAEPESFETYSLINHNGREMILVCANNRVYDNNAKAFIECRNYYNEIAGNFTLESNQACLDLGKFIENVHSAISEEHPFVITLSTKNVKVEKILYPKVDPYTDTGEVKDLLPKPIVREKKMPAKVLVKKPLA